MTTEVPFFGLQREYTELMSPIMARAETILQSGQMLQGDTVESFENRLAAQMGRKQAVVVNSCTDALYFALVAAGVQPQDEVLITDFSFVASASCIVRLGAVPVFVDINPATYNMDLREAEKHITPKTKALVFVHLYGQMADPEEIEAFALKHRLVLIEDAAQTLGAVFEGRPAGSVGVASCTSFDPTKPLSAPGSGGAVATNDKVLASRIKSLRYHGKNNQNEYTELGFNSQMSTLTAAVLDYKLDKLNEWQEKRRRIARFFNDTLAGLDVQLPTETAGSKHIYHKYVIRVSNRTTLKKYLTQHHIQTRIHYAKPLHAEPFFADAFGFDPDGYPRATDCAHTVLSLPIHPYLTDSEVETIAETLKRALATPPPSSA